MSFFARKSTGLCLLLLMTGAAVFFSLLAGTVHISMADLMAILFSGTLLNDPLESSRTIIMEIRLPRIVLALLAGGILAVAGTVFQALLRNPLADPFILGVSGGAALGGVTAMFFRWTFMGLGVPLFAFAGALLTILFVYYISIEKGRIPKYKMLLAGVVVNAFLSALIMLLLSLSTPDQISLSLFWLMGDLGGARWRDILAIFPFLIAGSVLLYAMSKEMNLLLMGEDRAMELGVNVERTKLLLFTGASLITGAVVSVCGLIGFVGLIIPHAARLLWGADHRFILPAGMLMGGVFLLIADTTARTLIAPVELPVGVITALTGAPVFVYLMKRRLHE